MVNALKIDDCTLISAYLRNSGNQTMTAKELGMTKAAVCRRLKSEKLQILLRENRKKIIDSTLNQIISLNLKSAAVLAELLTNENPFVRLQTVRQITALSKDYLVINDLQTRLDELEAKCKT
ncbi:hypothetical protein [Ruminococcus sp.]|uniref:hypothetical protein n=1 Tax=Ruminococcus sp. TaxID=41978 RepID=UPI00386B5A23